MRETASVRIDVPTLRSLQVQVALIFFCVLLGLPGLAQTSSVPKKIGFAQDTLANDWRRSQVNDLRRAFEAVTPKVELIVTDANADGARQVSDAEDLLNRKVDVLITSPRDGRAMAPVISRAYRAGTPVILLTRSAQTEDYTTLIGADDHAIARQVARFMGERLKNGGNVLMLQGVPTASTVTARTEGFVEELRKYPRVKISAMKVGNYLRADAIRAVEEVIQEKVPFDAIYAQSDSMASGARVALSKAGLDPRKLLIVGIDYISEAREAIRKGEQAASFTYPTGAKEAATAAHTVLRGQKLPKRIVVESIMVTRENVEQVAPIF